MIIPPEIREIILEYCLVLEHPITPYPITDPAGIVYARDDRKPDTALFRINRRLCDEAMRVFYGKNIFRLIAELKSQPTSDRIHLVGAKTWVTHGALIRHVITSFNPGELQPSLSSVRISDCHTKYPGAIHQQRRKDALHQAHQKVFRLACSRKIHALQKLCLQTFSIDVSLLYCPHGCCREEAIHDVIVLLSLHDQWYTFTVEEVLKWRNGVIPTTGTTVTVTGAINEEEHALVLELLGLEPRAITSE